MSEPTKERFTLDLTEDSEGAFVASSSMGSPAITSMYFGAAPMLLVSDKPECNAG